MAGSRRRRRTGFNGTRALTRRAHCPRRNVSHLPFLPSISCSRFHDWLYHKECFVKDATIGSGLQRPGLMSWRRYDLVLPRHLLHGEAEDVAAFAVAVGFPCPGGYTSGMIAASFRYGAGRVVLSTFEPRPPRFTSCCRPVGGERPEVRNAMRASTPGPYRLSARIAFACLRRYAAIVYSQHQ